MSIEDIIYKECSIGNLSPEEKRQLNYWLNEDPKHKKIYTQIKLSLLYPDDDEMDAIESRVWGSLHSIFQKEERSTKTHFFFSWIYKVAALIVLGLFAALLINNLSAGSQLDTQLVEVKMIEKVSISGQKITTTLVDGTKVKLNSESKLIVPEKFDPDKRVVELSGEAFFEVTENKDAPFIVKSGNMEVKVLGTSFNVKAYEGDHVMSVGVKTGKVEVKGINESKEYKVTLLPNDISSWNPIESSMQKDEIMAIDVVFGWTEQKLVFDNHSLVEVLNILSKWYGVEFIDTSGISNVAKRKYTAKYKNPSLEQMMISVAHVYDFNYEIDEIENEVILK